jgi:predicted enzyme related to lactoylglutathione lyase
MKILQVLPRIYLNMEQLEETISFYEQLFDEKCRMRFKYPEVGLELAQVGSVLLLAGSEAALEPFKATKATFLVDSLIEYKEKLVKSGAAILREQKQVPTGMNMLARHPDGTLVEYVQHTTEKVFAVNISDDQN